MDLDNEVTKLKMLEANYKSNRYRLEDKLQRKLRDRICRCGLRTAPIIFFVK